MAVINLYNQTYRGSVIMTGNSLGISTAAGYQIGAFSIGLPANTPPAGTTTAVATNNSSSARITIPATATVRGAFLLWSATSSSVNSGQSIVPGQQNNNVTFRNPAGNVFNVTPAVPYRQLRGTIGPGLSSVYSNAADVTSIVQNGGSGFYTIGSVVGVFGTQGEHNGFILIVAYEDPTEAIRNINIWTALELVAGGATPTIVDIPISGFATPSTGPVAGRLILSSGNGNTDLIGESVFFGPNTGALATLSGPNNAPTNFFASQINNNNGLLDTTGTFGNANGVPGVFPPAGIRNNWDITRVNASAGLTNNQTSGIIRIRTLNDTIILNGIAIQVDVNAANLSPVNKRVNRIFADTGDILVYTVTCVNSGLVSANNVIFIDTIPNGTTFQANSLTLNGVTQIGQSPAPPGFNIGTIGPSVITTLTFNVAVNTATIVSPVTNVATFVYNYIPAIGLETLSSSAASNTTTTTISKAQLVSTKLVNNNYSSVPTTLVYTITIANSGTATANNILFVDTIPSGSVIVPNSLKQDTTTITGTPNPPGVTLPNSIGPGRISTITFSVTVSTIPSPNIILNNASNTFSYTIDSTTTPNRIGSGSSNTNTVSTQIFKASLSNIFKSVDKNYVACGEVLTYTITIPNSGNVCAANVVFRDTIPSGTSLVPNSVTVDGTTVPSANPQTGVNIGTIPAGSSSVVKFSVTVNC